MWRDYSRDYIRNNRTSSISILAAAFIASLFLSFLCCLFYNFWLDSIEGTKIEDGDWHGRIRVELTEEELDQIRLYANVENVVVRTEPETAVDVYFQNQRTVYRDMNALLQLLELPETAADYNYQLLSLYFIRIPGDEMPRLLMPAYLAIIAIICLSLILVIQNSFAVSMNNRVRQFGILSSIGASPRQIRTCLIQEAFLLTLVPILAGMLLGVLFSCGTVWAMNLLTAKLAGGREAAFHLHPVILALAFLLAVFTVLLSAWFPAWKLGRLTPLEAIRGTEELHLVRRKHSRLLSALFGVEGELAGNALKAQRRALRTSSWSLTLAFLGFMLMQCFFTLSGISTYHTYFEAYQDAWDVMVTMKDTRIEDFHLTEEVRELTGEKNSVIYQKAEAVCILPEGAQSPELLTLGALPEETDLIQAPIVVLDDISFLEFCSQIGIEPRLDGAIIRNLYWDDQSSNFRYPKYIPYIREDTDTILLQSTSDQTSETELPVLACTEEAPLLREEYEKSKHPLVSFLSLSLWNEIAPQIGGARSDTCIRVLSEDRESPEALDLLEESLMELVAGDYPAESENRIQEKRDNDQIIQGYQLVLGALCVLFAIIGIAHVFSHTLGFLRLRRREFARYLSVGLTPAGMRKIFCLEALVTAGRPMLTALLLTTAATALMIRASYLDPVEFLRKAPVLPILLFLLAVLSCLALAYYLGGKKLMETSLADALRDDTVN